jgi:hypothetical protein
MMMMMMITYFKAIQALLTESYKLPNKTKTKLRGPRPRAKYTDRATAACR